ncbi:alcohol dehydrogenase catalytic domain-containing protein [Streptosporangium subroseum]|uniref:alcohol dehydrogenase catalytic domain-containing protein n=1 Tax=Streptosporangium subroseum TaxID=106412 RepID=UPI00308F6FCA|nr:alcohol dehydrogenase catalytic domain-containing protein [Streptosporangium subroseum]
MRAAVITRLNSPWEIQDIADPVAGPGQVVVRIHACGMCYSDVLVHRGHWPVQLPIVPGHEPVGEVVELGPGTTTLKIGDRVGVSWMQRGEGRCVQCQSARPVRCEHTQTWMDLGGGYADLMPAWETGCTLLPDDLSYSDAAVAFCAGFTAMSGLRNADPRPGERVCVLGIGGLGHMAVQLAAAIGLETVVLTTSPDKAEYAEKLGAVQGIVTGDDPGKALAQAGGADIVLATTTSADLVAKVVSGLRHGGRLVTMGVTGPLRIEDMTTLLFKQCSIKGSTHNNRADLVEVLSLMAAGKVTPRVETYPFGEINEVLKRVEAGQVRYRAVIEHG